MFSIGEKKRRFYVSFLVPSQWEWNFLWSLKFGGYCPITYRNYRQDSILLPSTRAVGTVSAHTVAPALIPGRTAPARLCKWLPQTLWSTEEVTGGIRAAVKGLCLRIYSEGGRTLCNWRIIQSGGGFLWLPGNNSPVELRNPDVQAYQEPGQAASFSPLCFRGPSFCCHRAPLEADGTGHGIRGAQRALGSAPPRRSWGWLRLGAGWPLLVSLFVFFPKDSSVHEVESLMQIRSLCCIFLGITKFFFLKEQPKSLDDSCGWFLRVTRASWLQAYQPVPLRVSPQSSSWAAGPCTPVAGMAAGEGQVHLAGQKGFVCFLCWAGHFS